MEAKQRAFIQILEEFPEVSGEFTTQNVKLLFPASSNAPVLVSMNRIDKIEDFAGMTIRATGYYGMAINAWGGTPVDIVSSEMYESMARGVIDGAFGIPPQTAVGYGLHEISKYFIQTGTGPAAVLIGAMNLDSYNKLPPDIQKIFDEVGAETAAKYAEIRMDGIRKAMPKIVESGIELYVLSDALMAQMEAVGKQPAHDKWLNDIVKAGISMEVAQKVLARFLELYQEYEAEATFKEFVEIYETEFK